MLLKSLIEEAVVLVEVDDVLVCVVSELSVKGIWLDFYTWFALAQARQT